MIVLDVLKLLVSIAAAFLVGRLVAKLHLPSILGWLITGMALGPHAFGFISQSILDARWFNIAIHILECTFGLMIGTELIWKTMKQAGKQIIVTTITESLGTFVVVSLVFGAIFYFSGVPVYLAFLFGGIALATAPAPSLSIVNDMKTAGPVTNTLIPMAALDDLVGAAVFFHRHRPGERRDLHAGNLRFRNAVLCVSAGVPGHYHWFYHRKTVTAGQGEKSLCRGHGCHAASFLGDRHVFE